MGLNKTNGNMYPWVTHTWNPLSGKCQHYCQYCYMNRSFMGNLEKYKGNVRLDDGALEVDLGSNNTIFVGSATDLFGKWVPENGIKKILKYCNKFSNSYLFQTKDPGRMAEFIEFLPRNSIIATTLETNRDYEISSAPQPSKRYHDFLSITHPRKMISIEPIMDFDLVEFLTWIKEINPEFVSIGADSKSNSLMEPSSKKINALISGIRKFTEIREKKNLKRVIGNDCLNTTNNH